MVPPLGRSVNRGELPFDSPFGICQFCSMKEIQTRWFTLDSEKAKNRFPRSDFGVLEARPSNPSEIRGGIVLIQEIFGVNSHIRSLAERYAQKGFAVWAPALFDHLETGVSLPYDTRAISKGRELVQQLGWEQPVDDIELAIDNLGASIGDKGVATIGFCWGGALSWLTACRTKTPRLKAAICYYGRQIWDFREEKPRVPVLMHFGRHDNLIPMENVEDIRTAHQTIPIYIYEAGHGFNCDERADFNAEAAALADERTMSFLESLGI